MPSPSSFSPELRTSLVVKLGGSLFDLPDLHARIDLLTIKFPGDIWLIPGGGRFADEVRRLDAIHHWTAETSHHLALNAMSLAARMISENGSRYELVDRLSRPSTEDFPRKVRVLDVCRLSGIEQLPAAWDVTSDSIAAWVALQTVSGRLLLAKSVDLPQPVPTAQQAARLGLVDAYFPQIAADLKEVLWVNLRRPELFVQSWLGEFSRGDF